MLWIKEKNSYWRQWILSAILPSFVASMEFQQKLDISGKAVLYKRDLQAFFDQSKGPDNSPTQIPEETILEIIKFKIKKKHWGPKKIREIYRQKHPEENIPCLTSVERILRKSRFNKKKKKE